MRHSFNQLSAAIALGAAAGLSAPVSAATIEVLTLGDSITNGFSSDTSGEANPSSRDHNLGGYRYYLDRLLDANAGLGGADFDFVGNRVMGSGISGDFVDNQHFGVSGAQASNDGTGNLGDGDGSTIPSILTGISNAGPTDSVNAAFDTRIANPNAVLLGIGINSLPRRGSDLGGTDNLATRLDTRVNEAFGQFVNLLDGDGTRTGLVDRLNDNAYFASDAHLFVAHILPRTDADNFSDSNADRREFIIQHQPSMVADYNSRVKNELLSRMGPGGELEGKVTFVDMFSIRMSELDLQSLADEFFSGEADPLAALRGAINPEAEGGSDETDFVDWVYNPDFTFDEGKYEGGTMPGFDDLDLLNPNGGNNNAWLMRDKLHPTNLGYAIQAQVWENAIEARYVPEPGAMLLFFGGGLMVLGRRGRRRS